MGNKLCSCESDFPQNENTDANLTVNYNKIQFELPKTRKGNRKEMMLVESLTDNDNEHYTIPSTNRKNYEPIRKFLGKMLIRYIKMQLLSHIKKKEKKDSKVQSIYDKLNQLNTEAKYNTQRKDIQTLPQKVVNDQKKSSVDTIQRKEIEELKKGLVVNNKSSPLSSTINNTYKKKETKYSIISNITTSSNIHEEEQVKPKAPPVKKSYIFKNKKKIIKPSTSKRNTAIFEPNKFGNVTKAPSFGIISNVPQKEDNYNKKTTIEESSEGNNMNNSSSIQESSNHHSDNLSYNEYD